MTHQRVIEQLRRRLTPDLYREIRRLWKRHVAAEDARDIAAIQTTFMEDCVSEMVQTGDRWCGHDAAARLHEESFAVFPAIRFSLANIVIRPQGVYQEINVCAAFASD